MTLARISSQIYSKILPPFLFRSNLNTLHDSHLCRETVIKLLNELFLKFLFPLMNLYFVNINLSTLFLSIAFNTIKLGTFEALFKNIIISPLDSHVQFCSTDINRFLTNRGLTLQLKSKFLHVNVPCLCYHHL